MPTKPRPSVRRNGLCARRGCKTKVPPTAVLHKDPFCSSRCSRLYHGVEYKSDQIQKGSKPRTEAQKRMIDNSVPGRRGPKPKYA